MRPSGREPGSEAEAAVLGEGANPLVPVEAGSLSGDEARRRAAGGVLIIGLRGIFIRLVGLAGNIVLARLLLPDEFGILALAITVLIFGSAVGDVGIGASLIRRRTAPRISELRSLVAVQLAFTAVLAIVVASAALPFGDSGAVITLMSSSLVLRALRTPGALVLERDLVYRPLAVVELLETLAFNGWAIATVYAGWGIWGPASGAWLQAVVGVAAMAVVSPVGLVLPGRSFAEARRLLRFGMQFQAVTLVVIARPVALNTGIAAISGTSVLAVWALAERFLAVPVLLFESLWRVLFPLMSRLRQAEEQTRERLERGLSLLTLAVGFAVIPLVATAPGLIPFLLGERWNETADALALAAVAFLVSLPIAVIAASYLYAQGRAGVVLGAAVAESTVWIGGALALLPLLGAPAVGLAAIPGRLVGTVMLARLLTSLSEARVVTPVIPATAAGLFGCVGGWAVSDYFGATLLSAAAGLVTGLALYLVFVFLVDRGLLSRALEVARFSLRAARAPTPVQSAS